MFWEISFCVGNKTIEVNEQEFSLGELSAECLNITVDDYADLHKVSEEVVKKLNAYEATGLTPQQVLDLMERERNLTRRVEKLEGWE